MPADPPPLETRGPIGRVAAESALYLGGVVLQRGLSFLLLPFATRILGPAAFGTAATSVTVAQLAAVLFAGGMNFALVRLYFDRDRGGDGQRSWAIAMWTQIAVAIGAGAVTAAAVVAAGAPATFVLAPVLGAVTAVQSMAQAVLRARRQAGRFIAVNAVQAIGGGVLALVWAASVGATGYVGGLAVGAAAAAGTAVLLTGSRPALAWGSLKSALGLSGPFLVHQVSGWALNLADRLMIALYATAATVGSYQVAYVVGNLLVLVLDAVYAAAGPRYYDIGARARKRELPGALVAPVTLMTAGAALAIAAAGPLVLEVLAPRSFRPSPVVVAAIAGAATIRVGYAVGFIVLSDRKDSAAIGVASLAGAVATVAIMVVAIPLYGPVAAAAATVVGYALQALLVLRSASRHAPLRIGRLSALWVGTVGAPVVVALGGTGGQVLGAIAAVTLTPVAVRAAVARYGRVMASAADAT